MQFEQVGIKADLPILGIAERTIKGKRRGLAMRAGSPSLMQLQVYTFCISDEVKRKRRPSG